MAEALVTQRAVTVPRVRVLTPEEKARLRYQLSKYIKDFWTSPEGMQLRMELSATARALGWDAEMERIMYTVAGEIKEAARRVGLDKAYRMVWGK